MILGVLAILFSILFLIVATIRRIWNKKQQHILLVSQHIINLLMFTNIIWISYKTLSMVSYSFLKPFLTFNLIYIFIALIHTGILIFQAKNKRLPKYEKLVWMMTIVFTVILCANILYWEFYY